MKILGIVMQVFAYGFYTVLLLLGGFASMVYIITSDFGPYFFFYFLLYLAGGLGIATKLKRRHDLKEAQELLEEVRAQTERTLEEMRSMRS